MKIKFLFLPIIFSILSLNALSAQSVVFVLGFETQDFEIADKMDFFADSLQAELAKSSKVQVVDRSNTEKVLKELDFQMTDLTSSQNVKSVGEMLNADYMIIGKVEKFTTTFKQSKYSIVAQLINVENAQVAGGAQSQIKDMAEFQKVVPSFAYSILSKIQNTSSSETIIPKSNTDVSKSLFCGKWEVEISDSGRIDLYTFTLENNGKASVSILSTKTSITSISTGTGRWTFSTNEKVFSITMNSVTGDVSHIKNILWKSIVNADEDMTSFSMAVPTTSNGTKKTKAVFYRIE